LREHYYEPVRRHLRPFLNDLFPGAELELGDGFAITGWSAAFPVPLLPFLPWQYHPEGIVPDDTGQGGVGTLHSRISGSFYF